MKVIVPGCHIKNRHSKFAVRNIFLTQIILWKDAKECVDEAGSRVFCNTYASDSAYIQKHAPLLEEIAAGCEEEDEVTTEGIGINHMLVSFNLNK
jgi:hypothetical protein